MRAVEILALYFLTSFASGCLRSRVCTYLEVIGCNKLVVAGDEVTDLLHLQEHWALAY